ncbi:MAG: COX15/CtaA family protein [Planctomycetes bacterium]|nr:COX15/CtaA family protein [Planctomycetota bacterium]
MTAPASRPETASRNSLLRWLSLWVVLLTVVMISMGALVTSRDAGLSIPDGVTNHGQVIPSEQLRDGYVDSTGRRYSGADVGVEFFHRVLGWTLGASVLAMAAVAWRFEERSWFKRLVLAALALVAAQGALGALGVRMRQPALLVVPHALLAQTFLCVVVAIAHFSSEMGRSALRDTPFPQRRPTIRTIDALVAVAFLQVLLGAAYRHASSMAAFSGHLAGAFTLVVIAALLVSRLVYGPVRAPGSLPRDAWVIGGLVMAQLLVGFLAFLTRQPKNQLVERTLATHLFPTVHVVLGAGVLSHGVLLALRARSWFGAMPSAEPSVAAEARP